MYVNKVIHNDESWMTYTVPTLCYLHVSQATARTKECAKIDIIHPVGMMCRNPQWMEHVEVLLHVLLY